MSGKTLKEKAKNLQLQKGSKYEFIRTLICRDFFDSPKTTQKLIDEVREIFGKKLKTIEVQTYMKKFMGEGIIRAIRPDSFRGNFWILASIPKEKALQMIGKRSQMIGKSRRMIAIEEELFSDKLIKKLGDDFSVEINDLKHNFGKSGNCTAFLLRKILEKLIFIAFSKNNIGTKLEDKTRPGRLVGLETMINLCASERIKGVPFLMSKTVKEIKGIKFLGDVSAHNPLTNVDMKTITPQMPYIITAYEELTKKL